MLAGLADVVEGADRLLRQVGVLAEAQADEVAAGEFPGEGDRELVEPLPGVHRDEQVVVRIEAEVGELRGEAFEGVRIEFAGMISASYSRSADAVNVVCSRRAATQMSRVGRLTLRRVFEELGGVEAEAAVVGDEAGVPLGHPGLDGLEVGEGEFPGGDGRRGEPERRRGQGAADLLQVDGQHARGQAQPVPQLEDEVEGVERQGPAARDAAAHDARRVDPPVVEREQVGAKRYSVAPSSLLTR